MIPSSQINLPLIDAHIHLFPDALFQAIWKWFDTHAWPILHKLPADEVLGELRKQGVETAVGLCYAHRPGLAEELNSFMAGLSVRHPWLLPFGTIFPGEPNQETILMRAFEVHHLRGIKIHCHVQQVSPDSESMSATCEAVSRHDAVLIIHAGRAPALPGYRTQIAALCSAERTARMLRRFPTMKTVVPHLGMDEYREYRGLLQEFQSLYLDTTMAVGGFFGNEPPIQELETICDRILFGTDFPNLPYSYRKELDALLCSGLSSEALGRILYGNAANLFGLAGGKRSSETTHGKE